jgi:hypothetical protein
MSPSTRRRRAPDRLCAEAVGLAREAVAEAAWPGRPGEWIEAVAEADRVVTHFFECLEPGYRGWRWAATVTRASRAKLVTVDETVLLPGPDALLAPQWLPWSERLRPGDLGPGDLLPTDADDLRLEPGFSGEDEPPPNSVASEEATTIRAARTTGLPENEELEVTGPARPPAAAADAVTGPARGDIASVAEEIGVRRARVLSRFGLHEAADRWEEAHGAATPMAQAAPASCVTCGFLVPLTGSLRQAFGVCANEYSPADGQVVSLAYGCGGHSEAAVMPKSPKPPKPVIDETRVDELALHEPKPSPTTETEHGETGD